MGFVKIALIIIFLVYMVNKFLPDRELEQITMKEFKKRKLTKDSQIIDVRTASEYRRNHIEGAINIPLNKLNKRINELAKEKETIVICETGIRSMQACKKLKKRGFNNVINIRGGMLKDS